MYGLDRKALLSTLLKYRDVFDNKLGHTSVVTDSIDTGDSPPICHRPMPPKWPSGLRPLPRVDDLLESLQGYNLFSTLDLRSGYWQLSVTREDQEKTAFATPTGLWEFLRMPLSLSGAPASFDRAIKLVMSGLNYTCCPCYFDDVIIPSNGIKQHCERLELN